MRRIRASLPLVPLVLVLAACGATGGDGSVSDDDSPTPAPSDGGGGEEPVLVIADGDPSGAGITVEDALGHGPTDDLVVVTGSLLIDPDGTVQLCDALAESFPPQCAGARMAVEGLDLDALDLQEGNGVRWADSVTLLGSVE